MKGRSIADRASSLEVRLDGIIRRQLRRRQRGPSADDDPGAAPKRVQSTRNAPAVRRAGSCDSGDRLSPAAVRRRLTGAHTGLVPAIGAYPARFGLHLRLDQEQRRSAEVAEHTGQKPGKKHRRRPDLRSGGARCTRPQGAL
eukprot:CAMPEP_0170428608 /NCGR_PEP_ID=MMETSP0117_2-20130122/39860_1 /TAXON_ID=400756 /ORGANISM="Durinskia baltica, Strain CSIRO CS-38" /LENGTH=141 /DNA_ID=CAMNT_0010687911 /DNA_START=376 /DNA_END=797 /DNA_ORIENTATION=-